MAEEFVQSLARGLQVITAFNADRPRMTLSEVAVAAGLSRAAARRFLHTLAELGYVRTDGRLFELTPHVLRLGTAYLSGFGLPKLAQPHLERLSAEIGESTSAAVLDGTDIVYVARVSTRRIMTVGIAVGTRFPAFATSMGRVLLAALTPDELDSYFVAADLTPPTPRTVHDEAALRAILRTVGEQGWAEVDQELEAGLYSLAAPIRDADRRVVAAINVSTTSPERPAELRDRVIETAGAVSADLASTALR
ncbi:IclR family transcriptional regulator domain-containing protein [Microlunatus ginsengisoli]|uniref:IclR family transcriptional regulator C-terminal domain-containing protein n=1 Tax=Microlunatus ginsengisoli TaxID=363863 RepID=A0ABP6ZDX8_9ACTN